jgi:hypothetical protein
MSDTPATWYRATTWTYTDLIEAVQVDSETPRYLVIGRRRTKRESADTSYHRTWGEAKAWLEEKAQARATFYQGEADRAKARLAEIRALQEPTINTTGE